jgi:hypothetical protein
VDCVEYLTQIDVRGHRYSRFIDPDLVGIVVDEHDENAPKNRAASDRGIPATILTDIVPRPEKFP